MLDLFLKKFPVKIYHRQKKVVRQRIAADKPLKSAMKAISWRLIGTLDTMIISYILTGKINIAVSIGGIEVISKTILYFIHERLWSRVHEPQIKKINIKIRREAWN